MLLARNRLRTRGKSPVGYRRYDSQSEKAHLPMSFIVLIVDFCRGAPSHGPTVPRPDKGVTWPVRRLPINRAGIKVKLRTKLVEAAPWFENELRSIVNSAVGLCLL